MRALKFDRTSRGFRGGLGAGGLGVLADGGDFAGAGMVRHRVLFGWFVFGSFSGENSDCERGTRFFWFVFAKKNSTPPRTLLIRADRGCLWRERAGWLLRNAPGGDHTDCLIVSEGSRAITKRQSCANG